MSSPTPGGRIKAPRRFVVKGTSGAGKSTFSAELARRLGLVHVELDALHHGPNWLEPSNVEFQNRVGAALAALPDGWVVDGNYDSKLGETVTAQADCIVWLDLPLGLKFRRVWWRTWRRIRDDIELWNGNRETWWTAYFDRDSIFVWLFRQHITHRREWPRRFAGDPRVVRLRCEAEVSAWLDELSLKDAAHRHSEAVARSPRERDDQGFVDAISARPDE